MQPLTVDDVFDLIGHFEFEQKIYFLVLGTIQIFISHHMLLNIYAGLESPFTCIPRNKTLLPDPLSDSCPLNSPDECFLQYNSSYVSIEQEWDLVCREKYKLPLVQSVFMAGVMMGALVLGGIADQIGRLKTLMISLIGLIAFEGFSAFAYSYEVYIGLRFCGGALCSLTIMSSFVMSQELIGASRRSFVAVFGSLFFSFGIIFLSVLSANIGDWRTLTFLCSVSGVVLLLIPCFLPESPRWLLIQGRKEEAKAVLESIAKRNGTFDKLPSHYELNSGSQKISDKKHTGIKDLFSHPYILKLTLVQAFSWFVNSAVYYALTLAAGNMNAGSVYMSTSLNGLVEVPAVFVTLFVIERFGRRPSICGFIFFCGMFCIAIPVFAPFYPSCEIIFALMGKLCVSGSFICIYIHSAEIFPTIIRNTGIGVVSVAARIGGIVSPFLLLLGDVHPYLQFLVLGVLSMIAGMLNLLLPETLGRPMPETITDIFAFAQEKKRNLKGYSKLADGDEEDTVFIGTRNRKSTENVDKKEPASVHQV